MVVEVSDTGIGLQPELLPKVFDLFRQGDTGPSRARGGLGLGLALSKTLVELHEGEISAASPGPGKGATFTVRLPGVPAIGLLPDPESSFERVGRKVLVVDDNGDAAKSLAMLLSLMGHRVETASSGPEALEMVPRFHPDVVLLDIGMPGMDGYEVARRLRRMPVTAAAVLIALTGYSQDEDRRQTREAGFDLHLVKPVDPDVIQNAILDPERTSSRSS